MKIILEKEKCLFISMLVEYDLTLGKEKGWTGRKKLTLFLGQEHVEERILVKSFTREGVGSESNAEDQVTGDKASLGHG